MKHLKWDFTGGRKRTTGNERAIGPLYRMHDGFSPVAKGFLSIGKSLHGTIDGPVSDSKQDAIK